MEHDILHYAQNRHTAKAYDANKKISTSDLEKIQSLLRFSPSSVNSQPWHFVIASTDESKTRIAKANESLFPFNNPAILSASHVILFCRRLSIEEDHLERILEQEEHDGRFKENPDFKQRVKEGRKRFTNLHKQDYQDAEHWMDKQVYLNLGQFLLAVSTLGIDATAMEGIDTKAIDEALGLHKKGYTSVLAVTLGYHDKENDYNARLPKSRLPNSELFTTI